MRVVKSLALPLSRPVVPASSSFLRPSPSSSRCLSTLPTTSHLSSHSTSFINFRPSLLASLPSLRTSTPTRAGAAGANLCNELDAKLDAARRSYLVEEQREKAENKFDVSLDSVKRKRKKKIKKHKYKKRSVAGAVSPAPGTQTVEIEVDGQTKLITFTDEEERKLVRKFDLRVLTLVSALFMMSFLDRSNIGNAYTAGMATDIGLSSAQYQNLLTIFYVGYVAGQPGTLLWKLFPPRIFVAALTLLWGGLALLQSAAKSFGGLAAIRLILGIAETAFAPGVTYYCSFFWRRREIGLRQGLYLGAAPIATAWAGTLAYGLTHVKNASIADWQLLFLVEGAPAILMVPVVYYFLPDRATTARFLSPREKEIAIARSVLDGNTGRDTGLKWSNVKLGLIDPKAFLHALMYFSANVSYSSLPVFLPTILTEMGFTSLKAQGLTAPPYLASFIVVVAVSFASDRVGDRSAFIMPLATIGGIGYLILALAHTTAVRYFATFLVACGIFPVIGLLLPWVANTHEDDSKRGAGFMLLNIIGQCGPFLGTRLYPANEKPYYVKGMGVCCAFIWFVAVLAFILRMYLIRENKRLDREEADKVAASGEKVDAEIAQTTTIKAFRYSL
ncbi:MFS transporter [Pseudohyphozyma bogoriensis]|nr:MFS transporter [Pseudohyphozyma bogoriensis]